MRAIFIAVAFWMAAGLAAAETRLVNSPGDGFLNLRTGPGSGFAIVRRMDHGSQVEVLESAGAWVRVQHQSGAVGWAFARYLAAPSPVGRYFTVARTSDGYLNLRTGPGTEFAIIQPMYSGSVVEVLENAGRWVRVRHESGAVGWASSRYLTR